MEKEFIIANITWNPYNWQVSYINPKAGHSYAKEHSGHESLNFKFEKKGLDTEEYIFGYIQYKFKPQRFKSGDSIAFYTKNTKTRKGEIVGIYANAEILDENIKTPNEEFENKTLLSNLKAEKSLSILFPIPLEASKYKTKSDKRLVGQIGFSYYEIALLEKIIIDEIFEIVKSSKYEKELKQLTVIYLYITGKEFDILNINSDEYEQDRFSEEFNKKNDPVSLIRFLQTTTESEPTTVFFHGTAFKRNNKVIAALKHYRNFTCQICGTTIQKKNKELYIEAAHIKPKSEMGNEMPDNILILCPNHHKEFDFGDRKILSHSKSAIEFELNGKHIEIDLSIKESELENLITK